MVTKNDFLFEILTEELPPKNLLKLSSSLTSSVEKALNDAHLNYSEIKPFASPRRLALIVKDLDEQQATQNIERRGPALEAAFDQHGNPTKACLGFAHSCNTNVKQLEKLKTDKGSWVIYKTKQTGQSVSELMPVIIENALKKLPIAKPMRWGNHDIEFVRPIHSIIMLFGKKVIHAEILGIQTGQKTEGHRFHGQNPILIKSSDTYESQLKEEGFVIADFAQRKSLILNQIEAITKKHQCIVILSEELIDEVTSLVEYPNALIASFPKRFLDIPKEALISSIQMHQKCFPLTTQNGQLLNHFITVSNIQSKNPEEVVKGNERVMNARLADAEFFYQNDLKTTLQDRVENLKQVLYQNKLGSLYDKSKRLEKNIGVLAKEIKVDVKHAKRAALLSKTDLLTSMVGEFPELQGIMGHYYALRDHEDESVAIALEEQYQPKNASDVLPSTVTGQLLSIVDRIDSLVGLFGIEKIPTGEKDPFALRRAAHGLIQIMIEKELPFDLNELVSHVKKSFDVKFSNHDLIQQVIDFILERLKTYLLDKGFGVDEFNAVAANHITEPLDFYKRIKAVKQFCSLPEAGSLASANKRVSHILSKNPLASKANTINKKLLTEENEIKLAEQIYHQKKVTSILNKKGDYFELLSKLASLKPTVDAFFDHVMVMVDDDKIRHNRLVLLTELRELFLQVADISLLQMDA